MRTSGPHEGNLRNERITFSGEHFLGGLLKTLGAIGPSKKRAPRF